MSAGNADGNADGDATAAIGAAAAASSSSASSSANAITTAASSASDSGGVGVGDMELCRPGGSPRSHGTAAAGPAQAPAQASHASLPAPRPLLEVMASLLRLLNIKQQLSDQLRWLTADSETARARAVAAPTTATAQAALDAEAQVQAVQRLCKLHCDAIESLQRAKAALEQADGAQHSQLAASGAAVASAAGPAASAAPAVSAGVSSVSGAAANPAVIAALLQGNGLGGREPGDHGPLHHSWPQIASTSSILHPAPDLLLPRLPPGKQRVRAVYVAHFNQHHVGVRYTVPERTHAAFLSSSFPLHCQLSSLPWRNRLDMQFVREDDAAVEAELSRERGIVAGEFHVAECMALPLNLLLHESLIGMEITGMTAFAALVCCFRVYNTSSTGVRFGDWLRERYENIVRAGGANLRSANKVDAAVVLPQAALLQLWSKLESCDVLLLPSILLMPDFGFTSDGWYARIREMADACGFAVHPRIEVEERMENKQRYMRHLNRQTDYEPLATKLRRHVDRLAQPGVRVASPPPPPPIPESDELFAGMGLIAPTVFVDLEHDSPHSLGDRLTVAALLVAAGAKAGGWCQSSLVDDRRNAVLQFRFKGANSTRVSHSKVLPKGDSNSLKRRCAPILRSPKQKCLLVQPELLSLQQEVRLFFANGIFMTAVLTDVRDDTVLELRPTNFDQSARSADRCLRAFNPCDILPQLVDFAAHVLRACEQYAELVSSSGLLRVDLGVEYKTAPPVQGSPSGPAQREVEVLDELPLRSRRQWQRSGLGWLFRPFTNEVTSSLDINVYSQNLVVGSMDLAQVQAHTVLQQIVKFARDHGDSRCARFDEGGSLLPLIASGTPPNGLSAAERDALSAAVLAHTAQVLQNKSKHVANCLIALQQLGVLDRS